jgi:DNA primase
MIKKQWVCYTCGAHGGLTGEYALIEPDYEQMARWFEDKLAETKIYPEGWLIQYTAGELHPYWQHRVGEEAAAHFKLGYDSESDAVTYPLRKPSQELMGVVRRPLQAGDGPKYLYPRNVDVGRLLFNYDGDYAECVVLVEGALDAIAFWNVGVQAYAIYGSRFSEHQLHLIDRVDPTYVVTAFDHDEAGWRAHFEVERVFPHRFVERLRFPASWGKDVDEIGAENLKKALDGLASPVMACID